MKAALLIIDVQRDFCPGGTLPAPGGDRVVEVINALSAHFGCIAASKDWHPAATAHFDRWPPHCIRATSGAAFHPGLRTERIDRLLLKGTGNSDDGYSAFEATNEDLEWWLRRQGVDTLTLCGLTTEYCVRATALDALRAGFEVQVVTDAVAPVEQHAGDGQAALDAMDAAGVRLLPAGHFFQKTAR